MASLTNGHIIKKRHINRFNLVIMLGLTAFFYSMSSSSLAATVYPDPTRYEAKVKKYEAADKLNPPEKGGISCLGSSSMEGWHRTIHSDLGPLSLVPRGISGSNMNDIFYYLDRLALIHQPRALLIYSGENDICSGLKASLVLGAFKALVKKLHAHNPDARVYLLSIKPSIRRWDTWPKIKIANKLLKAECDGNDLLTYIDISKGMLNDNGLPKPEIYRKDKLHMNDLGYRIWRDAVRPILHSTELKYEDRVGKEIPFWF